MSNGDSVDAMLAAERERIWAAAREYADHRALIEQAKGMLMFVYGLDADEAFTALRSQSQQHNVKLRLIAEQVVKDLVELAKNKGPARRLAFDGLMLTAHRRITDVAARKLDGQNNTDVPMNALGRGSGQR